MSTVEPAIEGALVELARDRLGSWHRSGITVVGVTFLERHLRDGERRIEGIRDLMPSIGLKGESSARCLLAQGFGAKSPSSASSSRSYADERSSAVGW